jgi:hypothetical protein
MSKTVVDDLEIVDIEQEDAYGLGLPIGAGKCMLQPVAEQSTIRQASQRIMESLMPQLLLEAGALDLVEALEVSRHTVDVVGQLLQLAWSTSGNAVREVALGNASQMRTEPADWLGDAIDTALTQPQPESRGQPDGGQNQEQALMVSDVVSVEQANRVVFQPV